MIFRDELDELGRAARRRSPSTELHTDTDGMLELADLDRLCPDWRERETWACGPGPMLDAISEHWEDAGLEDRLHLERFSLELGGDGGEGGTITFRNSGKTVEADGATTVLEAGEEAGVGHALRLPDGHLPHLHAHPRLRHHPRPAQRRRVRPAQRARPDLRHRAPSATARSTSDAPRPTCSTNRPKETPHGHRRRQGVHPPHRRRRWSSSGASSTRSAPTSRSRATPTTRRTSTG